MTFARGFASGFLVTGDAMIVVTTGRTHEVGEDFVGVFTSRAAALAYIGDEQPSMRFRTVHNLGTGGPDGDYLLDRQYGRYYQLRPLVIDPPPGGTGR
jgi:hypothetical protein